MILRNFVRKNSYFDSATLMLLTSKIGKELGNTNNVAIMMATEMNKDIMKNSKLLNDEGEKSGSNDLLIAVKAVDDDEIERVLDLVDELLMNKSDSSDSEHKKTINTVVEAVSEYPNTNMAVVSLPGQFAAREVRTLLENDKNVLLFSDNISLEEEIELKDLAIEKGLLMMGPDCGTTIINGVGLGFSNKVKRGPVGIVAASGTGLQEVASLVSNSGVGISHALGTGGRDVSEEVEGRMMISCLKLLKDDPLTEVIVIISKPPSNNAMKKILQEVNSINKPVVACFLNGDPELLIGSKVEIAETLEEASKIAIQICDEEKNVNTSPNFEDIVVKEKKKIRKNQKYIRGLYCGGTLAYESMLMLKEYVSKVYSNIAMSSDEMLLDTSESQKHTILDLGDDEFTVGRPHPMIDPTLRGERLLQESLDDEVGIILLDVEIGFGSHEDPASILAEEIEMARKSQPKDREVTYIASICGTMEDYQGYNQQRTILENAGVHVMNSNAEAVRLAMKILDVQEGYRD